LDLPVLWGEKELAVSPQIDTLLEENKHLKAENLRLEIELKFWKEKFATNVFRSLSYSSAKTTRADWFLIAKLNWWHSAFSYELSANITHRFLAALALKSLKTYQSIFHIHDSQLVLYEGL
jgi:hypothetical protein